MYKRQEQEEPKKIKKVMHHIQVFGLLIKKEVTATPVIPLLFLMSSVIQQIYMPKLQMDLKLEVITLKPQIQFKREQGMVQNLLNQLSLV